MPSDQVDPRDRAISSRTSWIILFRTNEESLNNNRIQIYFALGKYCVIAATISFGMGIDKATVRFVVHWSPSKSLKVNTNINISILDDSQRNDNLL